LDDDTFFTRRTGTDEVNDHHLVVVQHFDVAVRSTPQLFPVYRGADY